MASKTVINIINETKMDTQAEPFINLEPIPSKYGITMMLTTVIFFQMVNKAIISITGLNKNVSELTRKEWQTRNLLISWIHALIVSIWDLMAFYLYITEFSVDLIAYHNMFTYSMVAFSTGYFIYDFCDIVLYNGWLGHWEVLAHHCAVISVFGYNVVICLCIPYTCIALLAEVNSFFLHSRKLLQLYKWSFTHWFYRLVALLNLVSFPFSRFFPLVAIYYGMYTLAHRVSATYFIILFCSVFAMTGINIVLFYRLVKSDIILPYFTKHKEPFVTKGVTSLTELEKQEKDTSVTSQKSMNNNGHIANGTTSKHDHQD